MNLLDEAWIPVRRGSGQQDWITPYQITELDVMVLDARRSDFNGALIQFLIGLVQTTTPMDSHADWQKWNTKPPSLETLKSWFEPVREAFEFDGDGARFMQDYSLRTDDVADSDGGWRGVDTLLIEVPGKEPIKENTDHFIKRGIVNAICPSCVATALFTLQINAPEGGRGHYTSLRGGGPLTTLFVASQGVSLWKMIWMNIRERSQFLSDSGDASFDKLHFTFPWLQEILALQPTGQKTAPIQAHPAHVYWGMPRRIRLDLRNIVAGMCNVCGQNSDRLITRYITKPNGFNYKGGWNHPLSPYYESKNNDTKKMEWLTVHPQSGGIGYKDWLALMLGINDPKRKRRQASIVSHVLEKNRLKTTDQFRLWAFGYDMDSNKACCWYESTLPLYGLAERNIDGRNLIQREVAKWLEAASHTAFLLRANVKSAWFGDGADIRGDLSFIETAFYSHTESAFYEQIRQLIERARDEENDPILMPLRQQWREVLIKVAERLFDADLVGAAPIEKQNPRRTAEAYNKLRLSLHGDKLKEILKLPVEKSAKKKRATKIAV